MVRLGEGRAQLLIFQLELVGVAVSWKGGPALTDFPLTPRMLRIMQQAEQLAQQRGLPKIGTEHVILVLLDDPRAIATMALALVTEPARVQEEIRKIIESESYNRT